jgi:cytochrome c biogenesis protein CcdA/thiol-disulfide isomerase/thioredoxin
MLILMGFALIAGAATAITPCVLPVLPALLSASAVGGRRRPVGIALGLALTFTITIAGLASVIDGVGVADGTVRSIGIAVLLGFGLMLLWPRVAARVEAPLSRLARLGPRSRGDGFWSGMIVGGSLGFLYAPCAGPILAAVVSVSASQGSSLEILAIAVTFSAGSAAVLLVFALGGRRTVERIRAAGRGPALQRAVGVVMIATAGLMAADLDVRFQTALADHFPSFLVNPTSAIEKSGAVERRLADLRGESKFREQVPGGANRASLRNDGQRSSLPVLGEAPEFTDNQRWFNTGDRALTLRGLRGRVVLIDFWTYTCINCIRTLPVLRAWHERYRRRGLSIVGVHTPEFEFEKDAGNVEDAIRQNDLRYAVAQDNEFGTWNAWGNQYWPAKYLIDSRGRVRYAHFGEGSYDETEAAIRSLLQEAGAKRLGSEVQVRAETAARNVSTPETYLGWERAKGFLPRAPAAGERRYATFRGPLPQDRFTLSGTWDFGPQSARAVRESSLRVRFGARRVFLVMSSAGDAPRRVRVFLDGRPASGRVAGADARGGVVTVRGQRLYRLVSLPRVERRELELRIGPGVSAYAFTFG